MSRIPGNKKEKQKLLTKIDDKLLADLTGDILYFILNHTDIKIMDGPGDGKRDIHSIDKKNHQTITQCKYHIDLNKTVSSNETDQLVIALHKFKVKDGLFVTSSNISPQAKREYIDNYPEFNLSYVDGAQIVDYVFSDPILKQIWFKNENITKINFYLNIPFILKNLRTGQYTSIDSRTLSDDIIITKKWIKRSYFDSVCFSEKISEFEERGSIRCNVVGKYNINLHEINKLKLDIINYIKDQLELDRSQYLIIFASPYISSLSKENDSNLLIEKIAPSIMNINKKRIESHKQFMVLDSNKIWQFPYNLSVMQAPWAGWLNRKLNVIAQEDIYEEVPIEDLHIYSILNKEREKYLGETIFISGMIKNLKKLVKKLKLPDYDWECDYGTDSKVYSWMHPKVLAIQNNDIEIESFRSENKVNSTKELNLEKYNILVNNIIQYAPDFNIKIMPFKKVNYISMAEEKNLTYEKIEYKYSSAELFHDFKYLRIPLDQGDRILTLIKMWKVNDIPKSARKKINKIKYRNKLIYKTEKDARYGPKTDEMFLKLSIKLKIPYNINTSEYLKGCNDELVRIFEFYNSQILSQWGDAKESTIEFWEKELDFLITNEKFEGRPWIIQEGKKILI